MKITKSHIIISVCFVGFLLASCSNKKNTSTNRFLQSFKTRYNIFFNANENYKKALKSMNEGYTDDYTQLLPMYPVSNIYKDKEALLITEEKQMERASASDIIKNQTTASQGSWDYTIDKCTKAIKLHSISEKPKKKRGQSNNASYREFMSRTEYNPFLHNVWMLLAEARFYKGQFLTAASTFNYIARIYDYDKDIEAEARIWAARSYLELDWIFEAEDILTKLNNDKLPASQNNWFSAVYADFLLKQNKLREAVPFLTTAAKTADTKRQKARMTFLLGQIYTELGDRDKAYQAFKKVPSFNPPYELEFNARIKQTEVFPESNPDKILRTLRGMAKSSKNENYLEQVYYAIGNVYLSQQDTTKAVENYVLGVEKATRSGMEKAILLITLGDVYFKRQEYIEAQPCFSEAISIIQKDYKDYNRVARLSETLDELVGYVEEVQLQDSLQLLALKPESERIAIIEKIIEEIERKEKEERELAEREERMAENMAMQPGMNRPNTPTMPTGDNSFYFYNTSAVSNGKNEFQRKWGRRKLEDNWRRRDKSATFSDLDETDVANAEQGTLPDGTPITGDSIQQTAKADDTKSVEYYLQQIPTTPEQLENSNAIIADGYFNMAMIYKNKLEDYTLSIDEFNLLDRRYPDNEYRLEAYYNMFLMYLRMSNQEMATIYKLKLIDAFPDSNYAIAISDPNFEHSIVMMNEKQDSLYEATYDAYLANNIRQVRTNYEIAKNEYPLSKLMPKFMLLDAFTYASTGDANEFRKVLSEIMEKYPESEVNQLVGEMLKSLARGRRPASGGQVRGMLWNMRIGGDDTAFAEGDSIPDVFNDDPNVPYLMAIVYPNETVNTNELLFAIANYNFTHLLTRNFDLDTFSFNDISMVLIKGFVNFEEIVQYYQMFRSDNVIAEVARYTQPLLISESNFDKLIEGYSIAQYMDFYEEKFGTDAPVDINEYLIEEEVISEETPDTEAETETKTDSIHIEMPDIIPAENFGTPVIIAPKEMPIIQPGVIDTTKTEEKKGIDAQQVDDAIEDALEKFDDTKDEIKRKAKEKWNELIYGKPELTEEEKAEDERIKEITKEEKEAEKALKKEADEKAKAEKKAREAEEKAQKQAAKDAQKEAERLEREKLQAEKDAKAAEEKAEKDAAKEAERQRKEAIKAKEEARKTKEKERKELLKQKEADRKAKEKERKELQKQKEKERKERLKQKEAERKAKEKDRKANRSVR